MNICFLSKSQLKSIGGIETYTYLISTAFVRLGHHVHIITSGKNSNPFLENKYIASGIKVHKIDFENLPIRGLWRLENKIPLSMLFYTHLVCRKIRELIKEYAIDILETPNRGFEGLMYSYKRTIPLVVRLHGGILVDKVLNASSHPVRDKLIGWLEKHLIVHADSITSPSRSIAEIASNNYKICKPINIIPNSIDLEQFFPLPEKEAQNPTILYVGRFQELKGVFILAEAILKVLADFPAVHFILVGPDSLYNKGNVSCREFLCNKINDKRVSFYPEASSEELIKLYNKAWICVFPSFYESFGIVALEAMACGKAVIATKVGGFSEIIEDKVSGLLIPHGNVEALVTSIVELLNKKDYRNQLGENAYKRAQGYYSLDKIARTTLKTYEDVIDKFNHQHNNFEYNYGK